MQRAVALGIIVLLLVLAVLAYLGNALLFAFYLAALGNAVAFHWWYACSRCSNVCCALNVRSPHFLMRFRPVAIIDEPMHPFSNVSSVIPAVPLLLSVALGIVAAWSFSPVAVAVWVVGMAAVGVQYWRVSCVGCGNDCPANRNAAYLAWRLENGKKPESIE